MGNPVSLRYQKARRSPGGGRPLDPTPAAQAGQAFGVGRRCCIWLQALGLLLGLQACSPEYNWREVRPSGEGYQALFPGKPTAAERDIRVDGLDVRMKLQATQAGGHSFAVGVIGLPEDNEALRDRMVAAMRAQMARNIAASDAQLKPISVLVISTSGAVQPKHSGLRLLARGSGNPNTLTGGFVARGQRVFQWVVVGNDPDPEVVSTFIDGFRLTE